MMTRAVSRIAPAWGGGNFKAFQHEPPQAGAILLLSGGLYTWVALKILGVRVGTEAPGLLGWFFSSAVWSRPARWAEGNQRFWHNTHKPLAIWCKPRRY